MATLGSEPQVVTAALSVLGTRQEQVGRVALVHTGGEVVQAALQRLLPALAQASLPHTLYPVCAPDGSLFEDVETPQACDAAFRALYRAVWQAKRKGERVHLLLAGGRKTLAIYAMLTAQMLCDAHDCVWHLHSAGEFLASKRLYPQTGDAVQLVPIPLLLRALLSPALTHLRHIDDPFCALERLNKLELEPKHRQVSGFIEKKLTRAERQTVELLVTQGLADEEIAARLNLSVRTVQNHLYSAYTKAEHYWELEQVNRAQLVALLRLYYTFLGK